MGSKNRFKGYKEDSTKGVSMLKPRSYKGDALVQVWMDSRVLATMSVWLDKEGMGTRFLSEVVKESMKVLCDYLVEVEEAVMVDDTAEARDLLERKYKVNLNPRGKGLKNALHNKILSESRKGLREHLDGKKDRVTEEVNVPIDTTRKVNVDVDEAVRIYEELEKKAMKEEARKREKEVMKHLDYADASESLEDRIKKQGIDVPREEVEKEAKDRVALQREIAESGKFSPPKKTTSTNSMPRKLSEKEVEEKAEELEKKDKEYLKKLDDMSCAPPATA